MKHLLGRAWTMLVGNRAYAIGAGVLLVALGLVVAAAVFSPKPPTTWSYSDLTSAAAKGQVKSIAISGTTAITTVTNGKTYVVNLPDSTAPLAQLLDGEGVKVTYAPSGGFDLGKYILALFPFIGFLPLSFLIPILFIFILGALVIVIIRSQGHAALTFGASRARVHDAASPQVTFAAVAGCDEAKYEMAEIVEFLAKPAKFAKAGARLPRGVLLVCLQRPPNGCQ